MLGLPRLGAISARARALRSARGYTRAMQVICGASLSEVVGTAVQQAGMLKKLTLLDYLDLV